jgi:hypothetical protein
LSQLLPVAVEAVRIAFRIALRAAEVGNQIEPTSDASWSLILPGLKHEAVESILRDFSASKVREPSIILRNHSAHSLLEFTTSFKTLDQCAH